MFLALILWLLPGPLPAQTIATQRGTVVTTEGRVSHERPPAPPHPAAPRQLLDFGDLLGTAERSWAVIQFRDSSRFKVRELSTIEVLTGSQLTLRTNLLLKSGAAYVSGMPRRHEFRILTPHGSIKPKGTEFLIEVTDIETRIAMFDGSADLENELGALNVPAGQLGRSSAGRPPQTARLEAGSLVQWWLYYPAVIDPDAFQLDPEESTQLAPALAAYRAGALPEALRALPGYPAAPALTSPSGRAFYASLLLSVGAVDDATHVLEEVDAETPARRALRQLIAVVTKGRLPEARPPGSASEWLAQSYQHQSNRDLESALDAARHATNLSPNFAFAWARVAELEFSFGRLGPARRALDRALVLAPRHAQAHSLRGFILSAENRIAAAFVAFDHAISLDPGLGNAWLGRGLCHFRQGRREQGLSDLSTAAVLEPNRSLLHSYLAKAYAQTGEAAEAGKELSFAEKLDLNDPTPRLYSGLLRQEQNEINAAVEDLHRSLVLNDNRAVYRSQLLLDQDRAVRGANLASIFHDAGMADVARQEAARAVSADYANFSAHLFLAQSYSEVLPFNPQVNLRYETPRVSEYLVATLLAPVGAGVLSPTVSQQEYSKLLAADGFGLTSTTEYLSRGAWSESGAHWGTFGNFSYALDAYYQWDPGQRPNNDLDLTTFSARFQQQLTAKDSVSLQVFDSRAEFGDLGQYYDPADPARGANAAVRSRERQDPIGLVGYHREWSPQQHTLFLAGRLHDVLEVENPLDSYVPLLHRTATNASPYLVIPMPTADNQYQSELEIFSIEAQHIFRRESHGLILGGRFQDGTFSLRNSSRKHDFTYPPPNTDLTVESDWIDNPAQSGTPDFQRITGYAYGSWQVLPPLQLVAGLAYDRLTYPDNFRYAPLAFDEQTIDQLSPKGGFVLTPWTNTALRAAYSEALGGASIDQSFRLEPTQVAGFNQAWRSLIPESVAGSSAGEHFQTWAAALEQKLPTRTYAVLAAEWLNSDVSRSVGAYEYIPVPDDPFIFQTTTRQDLDFSERTLSLSLHQLFGDQWAVGVRYRVSDAELDTTFPEFPTTSPPAPGSPPRTQHQEATLHQVTLQALWNHPTGFFAQGAALWSAQSNRGYQPDQPGDDFWQFNLFVGYRFPRRQAEIRVGVLNLTDQDYQLNPLNLTAELPRERTLAASFRFSF